MRPAAESNLPEALAAFDFGGAVTEAVRYGSGHINDTFRVTVSSGRRFILQRINTDAFRNPGELMRNIASVTEYLGRVIKAQNGDPQREAMCIVRPVTGGGFYTDSQGGAWRAFLFVERIRCLESAATPQLFAASGQAFGRFLWLLRDFPAGTLFETIPRFHDTEDRLRLFKAALAADSLGRAKDCRKEIDFILRREADCSVAMEALRTGKLPLRVTHNDTKLNNILLDQDEDVGVCIIDLDTVMPGLAINDFGDAIRFGANHCAEDEADPEKAVVDLDLFDVYTGAYISGANGILTGAELDYLPWGAKLMTLECGIRFLTDYLEGDHYFRTGYPAQNLSRCQTQFMLVADMEKHWDDLKGIVDKYRQPGI